MYDGIMIIYKEPGYTSFDVVARLRGILRQKKIGHTGTLDPSAEGVLPVCLGTATRLCEFLTEETKTYEADLLLGISTDTQDTDGRVLEERPVTCTEQEVRQAALSFVGEQMQVPPMYSALKKDGKRLYELARAGIEVEREPRRVVFFEISVLAVRLPHVSLRVTCSRGTYIRTLCSDIGQKLGCGGCMAHLVRTRVGRFSLENARTLGEIQRLSEEGGLDRVILPVDRMFSDLRALTCLPEADRLAHNGNSIPGELLRPAQGENGRTGEIPDSGASTAMPEEVRIYDSAGKFIGIFTEMPIGQQQEGLTEREDGKAEGGTLYRVRRMFYRA